MGRLLKIKLLSSLVLTFMGVFFLALIYHPWGNSSVFNPKDIFSGDPAEHNADMVVEIYDNSGQPDSGNLITKAARTVHVGDEIITQDNNRYRISLVDENKAWAKNLGVDQQVMAYARFYEQLDIAEADGNILAVQSNKEAKNDRIGIYHSHTDESYVPSDGTHAIPAKGGIYEVGSALAEKLKNLGVNSLYDKTAHDPHDSNAYDRSRKTAVNIMKKENPIALLDVHRDGVPDPEFYNANVSGEDVTQIRLVVGRSNPKMEANLDFAKRLKAYTDKVHPGLIKEIFMAKNNYNQDLMSTALLLEAGTHTNTKEQAEKGITLLADAIPKVLGIDAGAAVQNPNSPVANTTNESPGAMKAIGWILGILVVGGAAFLIISSGSLKGAADKASHFFSKEFANFLGSTNSNKDNIKTTEDETNLDEQEMKALKDKQDQVRND